MNGELISTTTQIGVFLAAIFGLYQKNKRDQDIRHTENQSKLDDILSEREYLPAHVHSEAAGPLMAEGIRFRRRSTDR